MGLDQKELERAGWVSGCGRRAPVISQHAFGGIADEPMTLRAGKSLVWLGPKPMESAQDAVQPE